MSTAQNVLKAKEEAAVETSVVSSSTGSTTAEAATGAAVASGIEMYITNVVCSYSTKCHLNLKRIAMEGLNVEYRKENNMINMKLRKPNTTASIWSSGKITCTGATTEADAYVAARRICRVLQKMKFKVKLTNYRVVNVLATCNVPFSVDINRLASAYRQECVYEPELHPGATFKLKEVKATLKLFSTGSITLTAPCVSLARKAIDMAYPILLAFKHSSNIMSSNLTLTPSSGGQCAQQAAVTGQPLQPQPQPQSINTSSNKNDLFLMKNTPTLAYTFAKTAAAEKHILYNNSVNGNGSVVANVELPIAQQFPIYNTTTSTTNSSSLPSSTISTNSNTAQNNANASSISSNGANSFTSSYDQLFHLNNNFTFNTTQANVSVNSQSHWYNDSYLIDSALDDFLP